MCHFVIWVNYPFKTYPQLTMKILYTIKSCKKNTILWSCMPGKNNPGKHTDKLTEYTKGLIAKTTLEISLKVISHVQNPVKQITYSLGLITSLASSFLFSFHLLLRYFYLPSTAVAYIYPALEWSPPQNYILYVPGNESYSFWSVYWILKYTNGAARWGHLHPAHSYTKRIRKLGINAP